MRLSGVDGEEEEERELLVLPGDRDGYTEQDGEGAEGTKSQPSTPERIRWDHRSMNVALQPKNKNKQEIRFF